MTAGRAAAGHGGGNGPVDLDVHGHVGIRLLDATAGDVATVIRQLGPICAALEREPDITVRFVDRIEASGAMTYVGLRDGGFTDHEFYVLRGKANVAGRVHIPFADVGGRCHVECERHLPAVPLLLPIVNLTALAKGVLPLHASAFVHDGTGVLVTGWSKGGKTELLLSATEHGARYLGDEWIYISPTLDMHGVPEPIRLWHWQLRQLPRVWRRLPQRTRTRLGLLHEAARVLGRLGEGNGSAAASVLRRLAPVVGRQAYVQVPPLELFGHNGTVARHHLDCLVLVTSHDSSRTELRPVEARHVARRMMASLAEEREPFMAYYRQFRFAFPERSSPVVEQAAELEEKLLTSMLSGLPTWQLSHPYPVNIAELAPPVLAALAQVG